MTGSICKRQLTWFHFFLCKSCPIPLTEKEGHTIGRLTGSKLLPVQRHTGSHSHQAKRKLLVAISQTSKLNHFRLISGATPASPMSEVEKEQTRLGSCYTCKLIPSSSPETLRSDSKVSGEQQCSVCPYTPPDNTNTTDNTATSLIAVMLTITRKLISMKSNTQFSINF